jgi:hypothetical protein
MTKDTKTAAKSPIPKKQAQPTQGPKRVKASNYGSVQLGLCPKCRLERDLETPLMLIRYIDKKTKKPKQFAACKEDKECGYTAETVKGKLMEAVCPECNDECMCSIKTKDGRHAYKCNNPDCRKWFTADKDWNLVELVCDTCDKRLEQIGSKKHPGKFWWKCKECGALIPCDKYGTIIEAAEEDEDEEDEIEEDDESEDETEDESENDETEPTDEIEED